MKQLFSFLLGAGLLAAVAAQASLPSPDLMARVHFAGAEQISADTNAIAFTNLWCSPEARALRDQTLGKLSRAPGAWFKSKIPAGASDGAAQLRPLLDDLLSAEWFLQLRDTTNGSPEFALAIRLNAGRAQLWSTNLAAVFQMWTGIPAAQGQSGDWELKKHRPPNLIRFARAGDWVVFGGGQDKLPLSEELVRRILSDKRPAPAEKNDWLAVDLDWPRLARWFPALRVVDLPEARWQFTGRNGNLHLDGKVIFPQPLALTLEKWRVPVDAIRQPAVSFTAARGIAPWLEKQNWAQPYEISPAPNQIFIWGMSRIPLQTFAAVPVLDGNKALQEFEQKLAANTGWRSHLMLPVNMVMTNNQISWRGMPFIAPTLRALHGPNGDFLFAEVFPNSPKSNPLPPELFAPLDQTNLVYYDWEVTGERLTLLPQLTQLALMFTKHKQLAAQSAAAKWLNHISPTLGVAVTEVTQTAPNELSFTRQAPGGLTAFELTALANWLEATNFPGCDLRLPPPKPRILHPRVPGAPVTPTSVKPAPVTSAPATAH
ncbi:MAG: hypothetical protein WBN75_06090 [Verrucomicrobiia bacterium]